MKTSIWIILLIMSFQVLAESTLPKGCQAIPVQSDSITVKAKNAKLIFIHNITESDLWITHPVDNPSASAGWSSRLQTNNWSALVVGKGPFVIDCIESRPGHEQQIPCTGAIAMCQWKQTKMPKDHKGDFWAAEDMSLEAIKASVGDRGFVLSEQGS